MECCWNPAFGGGGVTGMLLESCEWRKGRSWNSGNRRRPVMEYGNGDGFLMESGNGGNRTLESRNGGGPVVGISERRRVCSWNLGMEEGL